MRDGNFSKARVKIGVKSFNMKINVKREEKKMKADMRKIGDRSGIGFEDEDSMKVQVKSQTPQQMANEKIMKEAEMLMRARGNKAGDYDILERLDEY